MAGERQQGQHEHQMRLAAVVVTFNRLPQIEVTLARLLAEPCDHVVVVDNGSTDGTRAFLAAQSDPRLTVIEAAANLGGAGGFERGMRHAVAAFDPDWLVLMDDDGRPEPGALARFRALDRAGDLADWDGVAAAVYYPDGRICDMNRPTVNPFWHMGTFLATLLRIGGRDAFHLVAADYERSTPKAIDITSFVGFFISREGVRKAGYPDPGLFVYGDDGLYTVGLRKAGGRIGFFPTIPFAHDCSTFADGSRRFTPAWKAYYYHRNLLFLYRAAAGWMFWPALLLVVPKWFLKARHQGADRAVYLRLLRRALADGLRNRTSASPEEIMALAAPQKATRAAG